MTGLDYAIIIVFLLVTALAGLAITRLIRDSDDLFVAGRQLTPFVLCATITATNLSMFHFVGMGGTAYQNGISIVWQNWTGSMALVLSGIFVVPLMRRLRIRSIPEFLQMRYSPGLRVLAAAFWGLKLCVYLGILLYIAATAAIIITDSRPTPLNYAMWLMAFSLVSILYSAIGGAWAVAIMDSVQFIVMLGGALIILPVAAHAAGGMPAVIHYLRSTGHENQLTLVPVQGEFNWLFICAITLLSIKWATIDQAILQRAFGARTPRIGAQGMVLSAIVTTPFAFFWILPGLATARLKPGFANPDHAIPWLLSHELPAVARGLLGLVLCGLVAAQISTITADVNSVATLFTSDVYRILRRREPSQRQLLVVVRLSSLVCGAVMLMAAWFLRQSGDGAVKANLTVVGILDMPLFVVTIVYGLLWKRANWQGAIAGFVAGGAIGVLTHFLVTPKYFDAYLHPVTAAISGHFALMIDNWHSHLKVHEKAVRNIVPILSSLTALIVTAAVSLLTTRSRRDVDHIWDNFNVTSSVGGEADTFHLIPITFRGRLGMIMAVGGFVVFLSGILSAAFAAHFAAVVAVAGMFTVLAGGLLRVYSE